MYFQANDGKKGVELWISDGTTSGTKMLKDINSGTGSSFASTFTPYAGALYFIAIDATHGAQLCMTDGTDTGTHVLLNSACTTKSPLVGVAQLTPMGKSLYFSADYDTSGYELWSLYAPLRTGINEITAEEYGIRAYPNPVSGNILNLNFGNAIEGIANISLINMEGKTIWRQELRNPGANISLEIPIAIPNGIYMLSLNSGKYNSVMKISIQR